MLDIVVVGPIDGLYHLGYWDEDARTFYSIQTFTSKTLADLTAWRMNQERQKGTM